MGNGAGGDECCAGACSGEGGGFGPDLVAVALFPLLLRACMSAAALRQQRLDAERRVNAIAKEARMANTEPLD